MVGRGQGSGSPGEGGEKVGVIGVGGGGDRKQERKGREVEVPRGRKSFITLKYFQKQEPCYFTFI